jgi:DNA-binding NarL/FixJ family response regulator
VDLIQRSKARCPNLPILILSMHDESNVVLRAIKAGASGYINKGCDLNILLPAIRKVASGGTYVAPEMAEKMLFDDTAQASSGGFRLLTDREMQVFNLLFNGVSVNDIATQLGISNKTVSTHKVRLMEKLELSNMVDLINYAQKHQLNS